MTQIERRRIAMSHAFRYQAYKREVAEYRENALSTLRSPRTDALPGSTGAGSHSDPTERAGVRLADMPEPLRSRALWVKSVEDAWQECREESRELAILFERNFRLTGETLGKEHNTEVREQIMEALKISQSTFYERLEDAADILVYHATKRKLL